MKNQLFRNSPDIKFTTKLLSLFGIKDLNDNHSFTKKNLIDLETVNKINEIIEEISEYYIPCKSKQYLTNINEKKCITILRQFLKLHCYTLNSKEKYVKGEKHLFYQVIPIPIDIETKHREKVVLTFD